MWYHNLVFLALLSPMSSPKRLFEGPALYKLTEPLLHGECPTWDPRTNILYYADILKGKIYSYNYTNDEIKSITLDGLVAPVVPSKADPNLLIIGLNRSVVAVNWIKQNNSYTATTLLTVSEDYPDSNFNDGKADSVGRIWFGTMGKNGTPNQGKLYKITKNGTTVIVAPVTISNGMAWNRANNKYYYIDSPTLQISEYDYNGTRGTIENRKMVFDLQENNIEGVPDGMTIDQDDNLWIALWGGGSVIKVNPSTGKLLQRIPIPASCVTSVMWGGPNLDILFVTTSKKSLSDLEVKQQPGAGSLYALKNLGTRGVPVFEADI